MAMESVDSFKLELEKFVALVEASKGSKMLWVSLYVKVVKNVDGDEVWI